MRGAIMQPTYMPWLGYFAMIDGVDIFVFLDDVQLNKRSWQTRNRIKERDGKELMLSIPLHTKGRDETRICDACFAEEDWYGKHLASIGQSYRKARFYDEVFDLLKGVYESKHKILSEFNISFISSVCEYVGIDTKMVNSSSMEGIAGSKDSLLVNICKKLEIDTYLSAKGSAIYIEKEKPGGAFGESGIRLEYQNYEHPVYKQMGSIFMPYMGIVDLLFNYGTEALPVIRSGVRPPFDSRHVLET